MNYFLFQASCSVLNCSKPHYRKGYCCAHYSRLVKHGDPLGGRTPDGEPLRFVNNVAMTHTGGNCLTWPYGKSRSGYGQIRVNGKLIEAHRYVCTLVNGDPPTPRHEAAHSCGKGHEGCVSPIHLSWKTRAENRADRLIHGTHDRGERHAQAKLTDAAAREIVAMKGVEPQCELAKRFGVSAQAIGNIHSGRRWTWLSDVPKPDSAPPHP